jgi:hypothetical protein
MWVLVRLGWDRCNCRCRIEKKLNTPEWPQCWLGGISNYLQQQPATHSLPSAEGVSSRSLSEKCIGLPAGRKGCGRCCASVTYSPEYARSARLTLGPFCWRIRPKPLLELALKPPGNLRGVWSVVAQAWRSHRSGMRNNLSGATALRCWSPRDKIGAPERDRKFNALSDSRLC